MPTFANDEETLEYIRTRVLWGNAAGTCKDGALARRFAAAGATMVSYGSITPLERAGNPGDNFSPLGLNALGIPNKGFKRHLEELPETKKAVNELGAQLAVSISAGDTFEPDEYYDMGYELDANDAADIIKGNFSCGNMLVGKYYKPIVCYDLPLFDAGVSALKAGAGKRKTAAKITPTTERTFLFGNVETCLKYGIDYIVISNTVPNCYLENDDGKPAIAMGRGGLSGPALRPIVTGMIQMVAPLLKGTGTKIIAEGGVECGKNAYNYMKNGAHGWAVGTHLWKNNFNPKVLQEIVTGRTNNGITSPGLVEFLAHYGLPD